jgi:hypothetical protein
MTEAERIAAGLSDAHKDALLDVRWLHPGGHDPIALVDFNGMPWPQGICEFFAFRQDRLTPLGLAVRAILKGQPTHAKEIDDGAKCT